MQRTGWTTLKSQKNQNLTENEVFLNSSRQLSVGLITLRPNSLKSKRATLY